MIRIYRQYIYTAALAVHHIVPVYRYCCMYRYIGTITGTAVCTGTVCVYSHQCTDQPGKIAKPALGQLNRDNGFFPVLVRA